MVVVMLANVAGFGFNPVLRNNNFPREVSEIHIAALL